MYIKRGIGDNQVSPNSIVVYIHRRERKMGKDMVERGRNLRQVSHILLLLYEMQWRRGIHVNPQTRHEGEFHRKWKERSRVEVPSLNNRYSDNLLMRGEEEGLCLMITYNSR